MGFFLPALTQENLDTQRDVVMNERRQRVENQPYGRAGERDPRAALPGRPPLSLAGDRLHGGHRRRHPGGRAEPSSAPTTRRTTRCSRWSATSIRTTPWSGSRPGSARSRRARRCRRWSPRRWRRSAASARAMLPDDVRLPRGLHRLPRPGLRPAGVVRGGPARGGARRRQVEPALPRPGLRPPDRPGRRRLRRAPRSAAAPSCWSRPPGPGVAAEALEEALLEPSRRGRRRPPDAGRPRAGPQPHADRVLQRPAAAGQPGRPLLPVRHLLRRPRRRRRPRPSRYLEIAPQELMEYAAALVHASRSGWWSPWCRGRRADGRRAPTGSTARPRRRRREIRPFQFPAVPAHPPAERPGGARRAPAGAAAGQPGADRPRRERSTIRRSGRGSPPSPPSVLDEGTAAPRRRWRSPPRPSGWAAISPPAPTGTWAIVATGLLSSHRREGLELLAEVARRSDLPGGRDRAAAPAAARRDPARGARTPRRSPTNASSARSTAAPSTPSRSTARRRACRGSTATRCWTSTGRHYGFAARP